MSDSLLRSAKAFCLENGHDEAWFDLCQAAMALYHAHAQRGALITAGGSDKCVIPESTQEAYKQHLNMVAELTNLNLTGIAASDVYRVCRCKQ